MRTIRLPVHLFEIISRMNKLEQKFIVQNGREATLEEVSKMMEMPESKITQIKKAAMAPVSLAKQSVWTTTNEPLKTHWLIISRNTRRIFR